MTTELEERMLVATMVMIWVVVMMNTHRYEFDGKTFLQKSGGPIGLRGTCAVAQVVMNAWDTQWLERVTDNNMDFITGIRYMDDIHCFMYAIREDWRGHFAFVKSGERRTWRLENLVQRGLQEYWWIS